MDEITINNFKIGVKYLQEYQVEEELNNINNYAISWIEQNKNKIKTKYLIFKILSFTYVLKLTSTPNISLKTILMRVFDKEINYNNYNNITRWRKNFAPIAGDDCDSYTKNTYIKTFICPYTYNTCYIKSKFIY